MAISLGHFLFKYTAQSFQHNTALFFSVCCSFEMKRWFYVSHTGLRHAFPVVGKDLFSPSRLRPPTHLWRDATKCIRWILCFYVYDFFSPYREKRARVCILRIQLAQLSNGVFSLSRQKRLFLSFAVDSKTKTAKTAGHRVVCKTLFIYIFSERERHLKINFLLIF